MSIDGGQPCTAADDLLKAFASCAVDTIFANPGTTEMPLVAALDRGGSGMRSTLALHENVCSAAADGYFRIAGRPAATLLHLGPGLTNSAANLHNARRARSGVINLVGDHPAEHRAADAPLQSPLETLSAAVSDWVGIVGDPLGNRRLVSEAISRSRAGQIATLLVPHDAQTGPGSGSEIDLNEIRPTFDTGRIGKIAAALRAAHSPAILLGGTALSEKGLLAGERIAKETGAELLAETFFARMARGAGLPSPSRLPYFPEQASKALEGFDLLVLVGAAEPVAFFKYEGMPSLLTPAHARVLTLTAPTENSEAALAALCDEACTGTVPPSSARNEAIARYQPSGAKALDAIGMCRVIAAALPDDSIVVDEGITSTLEFYGASAEARRFDHLTLTGGAIGWGPGAALGAAIAGKSRKVINIQADGSGLYLPQALWSQARESAPVVTVICSNRRYRILDVELARAGIDAPGPVARGMCDLGGIDWLAIAKGFGVSARSCATEAELADTLAMALAADGPFLIEAQLT